MMNFLTLSTQEKVQIFTQAALRKGIPTQAVEKDWWVCLALKAVFTFQDAPYFSFKGGTSLSKGWQLIERFSEDIDLAVDKSKWGYDDDISNADIRRLRRQASTYVKTDLKNFIEQQFTAWGVPEGSVTCNAVDVLNRDGNIVTDQDPTEIIISYQSLFEQQNYIAAQVKIEVSARSMSDPVSICQIQSFVDEIFAGLPFAMPTFPVTCVHPSRTFLEKATLLHEGFVKKIDGDKAERKSRHLYDLVQLMDTAYCKDTPYDEPLFERIIIYRKKYTGVAGVDYETLTRATIDFIPPDDSMVFWAQDYKDMCESMIQGETLDFETLLAQLKALLDRFRTAL